MFTLCDLITISVVDGDVRIFIPQDSILLLQGCLNSFINSIPNSLFGSTIILPEANNLGNFNPPKSIIFGNFYNLVDIYAGYQDIVNNIYSRPHIYIDPIHSLVNNLSIPLLLAPLVMLALFIKKAVISVFYKKALLLKLETFFKGFLSIIFLWFSLKYIFPLLTLFKLEDLKGVFILLGLSMKAPLLGLKNNIYNFIKTNHKKPYFKSFLVKKLDKNNLNILPNLVKNVLFNTVPNHLRSFQVYINQEDPQVRRLIEARNREISLLRNRANSLDNFVSDMIALTRQYNIRLVVTISTSDPNDRQLDFIYPADLPDNIVEQVRSRGMSLDNQILTTIDNIYVVRNNVARIELELTYLNFTSFSAEGCSYYMRRASNAVALYNSILAVEDV